MKPGDLYVGVLDVSAVLLPGSVLAGFLTGLVIIHPFLKTLPLVNQPVRYAALPSRGYEIIGASLSAFACILSLIRCADQRCRSTGTAHRHVIVLCTPDPCSPEKNEGQA